jgi:adenosine deaminase
LLYIIFYQLLFRYSYISRRFKQRKKMNPSAQTISSHIQTRLGHNFSLNIDEEGLIKYTLDYDESTHQLSKFHDRTLKYSNETKTLQSVFESAIQIIINDKPFLDKAFIATPKIDIIIKLGNQILVNATYDISQKTLSKSCFPICTYDMHRFNQSGLVYIKEFEKRTLETPPPHLLADLHTHFTGAPSAKCLVDVIRKGDIPVWYPIEQLRKSGILFSGDIKDGKIDLSSKTTQLEWQKFQNALSIHPLRVSLFPEMEDIYNNRNPIMKNAALFEPFLIELAKDYQKNGIEYAELSLSDVVNQEWLDIANRILPTIERTYGVSIRFLVGIWRHSPKIYNEDLIGKIKAHLNNPYIMGVDIMGQETNSTNDFVSLLDILNSFKKERPDYVIRVHAGESPCHPDNVKIALEHGATRIGHGIHGFCNEISELAKRVGAIFELCISSNNALHSITNPEEIPLKTLINLGVKVTLGTDGQGLYRTTHVTEATLARRLGLTHEEMGSIVKTNREYINKTKAYFLERMSNPQRAFQLAVFPIPQFPKDGWKIVEAEKALERKKVEDAIKTIHNSSTNVSIEVVNPKELDQVFKGLTPILFAGASSINWIPVSEIHKIEIQKTIHSFFKHLDPDKVVIVTGGTDFGLEKLVHEEVEQCAKKGRRFKLLGGLATHLQVEISTISKSLTHASCFDYSWYDTPPHLLPWVKKNNGMTVFIGGGDVVKGMISISKNLDIDFLVMEDVYGSSSSAALLYPEHSFKMGEGRLEKALIKKLRSTLLKSAVVSVEEATKIVEKMQKRVISFLGYSSDYADEALLEQTINDQLKNCSPKDTLINAGGTRIGIGIVYKIAKEMGFETLGIVSTRAKPDELSEQVDFVIYIEDAEWGGYDEANGKLYPVSSAIVRCTDTALVLGGGIIAQAEMLALRDAGKDVIYIPFPKRDNLV